MSIVSLSVSLSEGCRSQGPTYHCPLLENHPQKKTETMKKRRLKWDLSKEGHKPSAPLLATTVDVVQHLNPGLNPPWSPWCIVGFTGSRRICDWRINRDCGPFVQSAGTVEALDIFSFVSADKLTRRIQVKRTHVCKHDCFWICTKERTKQTWRKPQIRVAGCESRKSAD